MTSLYLIRHGEAFANTERIVGGMRGDTGLTPRGVLQAERLRDRLAATHEIAAGALLASSFPRARQTAEILAPALGLPVTLDDELQELRPGEADGLTLEEAMTRYSVPDFEREPARPVSPGGESWQALTLRAARALERLTAAHAGQTLVVVTHGGVIDSAFIHFLGLGADAPPRTQFPTRHTSITHWQHKHRWNGTLGWHLVTYNDSAHLLDLDRPARIPWEALARPRS